MASWWVCTARTTSSGSQAKEACTVRERQKRAIADATLVSAPRFGPPWPGRTRANRAETARSMVVDQCLATEHRPYPLHPHAKDDTTPAYALSGWVFHCPTRYRKPVWRPYRS